jgi:alkanesulfonate monooxygenase SsuD/methylene tetrahydromethanopterin reductase-like flavin-dependent oxidoreductase (luciferase family)
MAGDEMRMRFDSGLLVHAGRADNYPPIEEWRATAKLLESAGFTALWCAEHHFFWDGWTQPTPTNPLLFGAFMAGQTETLRMGQCGVCLPDWHPIRVVEDVAMLDHMTGGRVDFGMIRGLNSRTSLNFNVDADRRDQERNKALFWETYEIVQKAWGGRFSHEGEFYTFPVPGWRDESLPPEQLDADYYGPDGELIALEVQPSPYQQPFPPTWLMADSLGSSVAGAKRDLGVISWGQTFELTREVWGACRAAREAELGAGSAEGERLGIMRPVFVARTAEEAEAAMRPSVNMLFDHIVGLTAAWAGRKAFLASDEELTDEALEQDWFDFLNDRGWCLVGTPEQVTEQLKRFESELGCKHLINYWALPLIEFDQMIASTKLFADEVMPHF